jgi:uncharacterized protein YaaN involved in tellurite resistance
LSQVIANNGQALLKSVRGDNTAEVVQLSNELLAELNLIDIDEINQDTPWKNFARRVPLLRRMVTTIENVKIKYDSIAENVDKISEKMGVAKVVALRDNTTLQDIFNNNRKYIDEIRDLILALKLRLEQVEREIQEKQTDPTVDAITISDLQSFKESIEKRIADMVVTEHVLTQNLFQIRATQSNNTAIATKSDNIVTNVIPLWKNQLAIAVIMNNQKASIDAQRKISDTTNEILKRNAANLRINSVNVAKANEEMVISLDTLQKTTQELIATVTEVKKIHEQGAQKRKEVERVLESSSNELMTAIQDTAIPISKK